ncbi:MAG TPA: hypothetical protein VN626_07590 [Clostridia bacterium]|nr:hypothetical protein [Clostridia bacterium]
MLSTGYIELKDANAYVIEHHLHVAVSGYRFSLVCYENGKLCGIAAVGRPRVDKAAVCPNIYMTSF